MYSGFPFLFLSRDGISLNSATLSIRRHIILQYYSKKIGEENIATEKYNTGIIK